MLFQKKTQRQKKIKSKIKANIGTIGKITSVPFTPIASVESIKTMVRTIVQSSKKKNKRFVFVFMVFRIFFIVAKTFEKKNKQTNKRAKICYENT